MQKEKVIKLATLCFPVSEDGLSVLMSRKVIEEIHKPGAGKLNGYGGVPEKKESLLDCAKRELFEECGLSCDKKDLKLIAIVYFHNILSNGEIFVCKVYIYLLRKWTGKPVNGDKMFDPKWYPTYFPPFWDMMPADKDWYIHAIIMGDKIIAYAYYGPFQMELVKPTKIRIVQSFPK